MLTKDQIFDSACRLEEAEVTRTQIRQLSLDFPSITIEDGYAIQRASVNAKIGRGAVVKGHKSGLTSRAIQMSWQISKHAFGTLLDGIFFADCFAIPINRFIVPTTTGKMPKFSALRC